MGASLPSLAAGCRSRFQGHQTFWAVLRFGYGVRQRAFVADDSRCSYLHFFFGGGGDGCALFVSDVIGGPL